MARASHRRVSSSVPDLSTCISVTPTGRISAKFDVWVSYENVLTKYKFGQNVAKIWGNLHEDLSTFCCCWQNHHKSRSSAKCYQVISIAAEVQTLGERAKMLHNMSSASLVNLNTLWSVQSLLLPGRSTRRGNCPGIHCVSHTVLTNWRTEKHLASLDNWKTFSYFARS